MSLSPSSIKTASREQAVAAIERSLSYKRQPMALVLRDFLRHQQQQQALQITQALELANVGQESGEGALPIAPEPRQ